MGAAYLPLPDMPADCTECPVSEGGIKCKAARKPLLPAGERPDWCPLRAFPQKRTVYLNDFGYADGYTDGWNKCLEEMF